MKKFILSALVAVAAINANAQFYLGGSLGFTSTKNAVEYNYEGNKTKFDATNTNFNIAPEIGYKFDDKMAVGLSIGFTTGKEGDIEDKDASLKANAFTIQPYFRYTFVKWNKVSLFADVELGLAFGKVTNEYIEESVTYSSDTKVNDFHIAIVPGVAYQASDAISVVAKLGNGLGYWSSTIKPNDNIKQTASEFGLDVNTLGLTIGVYYNF